MSLNEVSLRYAQGEVFNSEKRFRLLVAGRRFGKSYLSCIELLRGAIERPGEVYFYCAPTYRMAKDIAWKELKKLVPKVWVQSKNETDLRLDLINGSSIELKGTENAMALRGRSLAGVVLDEAAFMDRDVWAEVIRPALADKQGWALFISTPDGTASWFYDMWCFCGEREWEDWQRWFPSYDPGGVFNSEKRFRVLVAGRRFGKSYLSCIELLRGAINRPGEVYFYCAPTYRMAKDIAWKELKKLVPKVWVQAKNETDLG
jgi:hypothetical protein